MLATLRHLNLRRSDARTIVARCAYVPHSPFRCNRLLEGRWGV